MTENGSGCARGSPIEGTTAATCDQGCDPTSCASKEPLQPATNSIEPHETDAAVEKPLGICPKCKERPAEIYIRKQYRACYPCLEAQLASKIRLGFRSRYAVVHSDRVALAFSGGPSSTLLLHYLQSMRDMHVDRWNKLKMAFDLTVLHVADAPDSASTVEQIASKIINTDIIYQSLQLSDVFLEEESDPALRQEKLAAALAAVRDPTGRADLETHVRRRVLMDTCRKLQCSKLLWAHNATDLAIQAVASAVKGAGYALPGDAQHVDCRHAPTGGPIMVYPMRDISSEEIELLGRRLGLSWVEESAKVPTDKHNINDLATIFVQNVLNHNPGAVHNINSTISRLEAFPWNEMQPSIVAGERKKESKVSDAVIGDAHAGEAQQPPETFCPLCSAPLADDEVIGAASEGRRALAGVCDSCIHQIFGGAADGGEVLQLLPRNMAKDIAQSAEVWAKASEVAGGEAMSPDDLRRRVASVEEGV